MIDEQKKRFENFFNFITRKDEYGNNGIQYLGYDMFPNLESLFNAFLEKEKNEKQENKLIK